MVAPISGVLFTSTTRPVMVRVVCAQSACADTNNKNVTNFVHKGPRHLSSTVLQS